MMRYSPLILSGLTVLFISFPKPILAEGRDDPFLKCTFENDRVVIFAEDGDNTVWIENESRFRAIWQETAFAHTPLKSIHKSGGYQGDETITILVKYTRNEKPKIKGGASLLSQVTLTPQDEWEIVSTKGHCERYIG